MNHPLDITKTSLVSGHFMEWVEFSKMLAEMQDERIMYSIFLSKKYNLAATHKPVWF